MARRVLEAALKVGQDIEQGLDYPTEFKGVDCIKEIKTHESYKGVFSLQYNYDGSLLAVGYGSGGIQLFEAKKAKMYKELRPCRHGGYAIMVLRFHPKDPNLLYAASAEGIIYVYNISKGTETKIAEEKGNEINCLDFCVDGFNYASAGKDLHVRMYDTKTNKLAKVFEGYDQKKAIPDSQNPMNTMRVFALKFHPDNEYVFVSGGWDNQLKIWDTRSREGLKRSISGPHICGDAIDMKGNNILTGSWRTNHCLEEYDYTSLKVVRDIPFPAPDGGFLYCCQYCDNDVVLAGGSGTNSCEAIHAPTGKHLGGIKEEGPVQAVDSALGGRLFAVGSSKASFKMCALV